MTIHHLETRNIEGKISKPEGQSSRQSNPRGRILCFICHDHVVTRINFHSKKRCMNRNVDASKRVRVLLVFPANAKSRSLPILVALQTRMGKERECRSFKHASLNNSRRGISQCNVRNNRDPPGYFVALAGGRDQIASFSMRRPSTAHSVQIQEVTRDFATCSANSMKVDVISLFEAT